MQDVGLEGLAGQRPRCAQPCQVESGCDKEWEESSKWSDGILVDCASCTIYVAVAERSPAQVRKQVKSVCEVGLTIGGR